MPNLPPKILRSGTAGARPSAHAYGEPYVNFADGAFGVVNSAGVAQDIAGPSFAQGFVNKLRNGAFDVWQRGVSVSATNGAYTADGWILSFAGAAGPLTVQRSTLGAGFPGGGASALGVIGAAGITTCTLSQRIESYVAAQLTNTQPMTVSFWMNPSISLTPQLQVGHCTTIDTFPAPTIDVSPINLQPCLANTWTRVSYTFTLPSGAQQAGLQVWLLLGAIGTATVTIAAADLRATPGLPVGLCANPPPPELRPIHEEMVFCQRYFAGIGISKFSTGYSPAGNSNSFFHQLPTKMRATPTLVSSWSSLTNATVNTAPNVVADNQTIYTTLLATAVGAVSGSWAITSASAEL